MARVKPLYIKSIFKNDKREKTVNDSFKKSDYKENMIAEEYSFREGFLIFKM